MLQKIKKVVWSKNIPQKLRKQNQNPESLTSTKNKNKTKNNVGINSVDIPNSGHAFDKRKKSKRDYTHREQCELY